MSAEPAKMAASGVEALIQKLKDQGIAAGQEKAEQIVADAHKRAEWIIQEAEREAQLMLGKAKEESELIRSAGEQALKLAARDACLKLRDYLLGSFSKEVTHAAGEVLAKEDFLRQLILELAGRLRQESGLDDSDGIVIQIPRDMAGIDGLRKNPELPDQDVLGRLTAAISNGLLRDGVRIEVSDRLDSGLLIKLVDDNLVIEFTAETVAALLLEHLQPRFRALLQGVVK